MPTLNVMSLNVGRLLEKRTRQYLFDLALGMEEKPDVLCIQDVPFRDLWLFEWVPHISFAPMTNHLINGERAVVGIAIVSRYFMTNITHHTTWGDGTLKNVGGINDQNQRYLGDESDTLVEATEDRVAMCATVVKDGTEFDIATTHGMWVRHGVTNYVQRKSAWALIDSALQQAHHRHGLVLLGDLNFARGGEIYTQFVKNGLVDCMPTEIDSTLDPDHPFAKKGGKVVTDWIFNVENSIYRRYSISDVRLRSGVSDHCALSATITKEE